MKRRFLCQALACLAVVSTSGLAFASPSPETFQAKRPLRLIAPSSPGEIGRAHV